MMHKVGGGLLFRCGGGLCSDVCNKINVEQNKRVLFSQCK
jgi:hypothetical protein